MCLSDFVIREEARSHVELAIAHHVYEVVALSRQNEIVIQLPTTGAFQLRDGLDVTLRPDLDIVGWILVQIKSIVVFDDLRIEGLTCTAGITL